MKEKQPNQNDKNNETRELWLDISSNKDDAQKDSDDKDGEEKHSEDD